MSIRLVRRISQVFFVVLFLWFCVVSSVGTNWWQLRGWPVNWLLQLDPLVALGTLLATHKIYAGLLWALATVVLTIVLGRFFCGWVCPFGSLHQFVGYMGRRKLKFAQRVGLNQYRPAHAIKYYLLIVLLTAAAGTLLARVISLAREQPLVPWLVLIAGIILIALLALQKTLRSLRTATVTVVALVAAWIALARFGSSNHVLAASLQTGLLDPIPLIHRSVNLVVLPLAEAAGLKLSVNPRFYEGAWLIGTVFLAAILLNFLVPRFYCRILCPLGALFGVLGRFAIWRIGKVQGECKGCEMCEDNCEGGCEPFEKIRISDCLLCMNCRDACRQAQIEYRTAPSAAGEVTSPDVTRRGFLIAASAGLAAVPMLRVGGLLGSNWRPHVIRPPGALAEEEFLDRCIKCGQCMRVCPTNIIQPAGLQGGIEAIWTPMLNFRVGTSGCQLNCVACGNVCPTAAIRPLTLDEKTGRGAFEPAGPIRMGTAFVDRGRCLPWAMDKPCIVCQENCPVSPKAIYLREEFQTIRDGVVTVTKAEADTIQFDGAPLGAGRFGSGDYCCKVASAGGESRYRIDDYAANRIRVAVTGAWQRPAAGSSVEIQVRLQRPLVDPRLCTGCGICEHECPVQGLRAIRVTAENETRNRKHALVS